MKIDDFLIRTTIRIESYTDNGIATGTGFFFNFTKNGDDIIPVIVTNKHVVKNGKLGKLVFSIIDKNDEIINGEKYSVNFHDFEKAWIKHPDDNVDLCVLPIAQICDSAIASGKKLAISCLIKDNIISDEYIKNISKVEDIAVVGYPDGIWDSYNNLPIVRKGITATPISYNFENKNEFLIDAAIYGGSSGSPVFIFNQGSYSIGNSLYAGDRLMLIGIVYAVAQHTVSGNLEFVDIPVVKQPLAVTQIPNNLGVVIKAKELLKFEDILFDLANQKHI